MKNNRLEEKKRRFENNLAWHRNAILYRAVFKKDYTAPKYDDVFIPIGSDTRSGREIVNELKARLKNGNADKPYS